MGGGRQAGDGAEVALRVDEAMAHGPVLGHADERRVDRLVAVRVVALHRLADDAGALAGRGGRAEAEVVHRHEDAALRRLEAVAHVGQGPADDDAHRVGEVAVLQLVRDVERFVVVAVAVGTGREGRSRGSIIVGQGSFLDGCKPRPRRRVHALGHAIILAETGVCRHVGDAVS